MELTQITIRDNLVLQIAPLTTKESIQADQIIGQFAGDNPTAGALALVTSKVYSICAVRRMNDSIVTPLAGGAAFEAVCQKLSLQDLRVLMTEYSEVEGMGDKQLKNGTTEDATEQPQP